MVSPVALALFGLLSVSQAAVPRSTTLSPDDVIVLAKDGSSQVMKATEFEALEAAPPLPLNKKQVASSKKARRCEKSTEVQVTSDKEFLNWDVAISPVISSTGGKATVSVSSGYSISNSVSVGGSYGVSIESILSLSLTVDYTESWSSSQEQSLTFEVPDGQHGVIVSQPYVRRVEGNILSGCTDSPDKEGFVSDSYSSRSYGNLNWVDGLIRLCNSTTYPIPYCNGDGAHK
ncbi:hypothetical protein FDECE_14706 [Fusarium decemcellulare]|nr:hypothetical protein FDECE_14706 [Fusarium decemcellulare]